MSTVKQARERGIPMYRLWSKLLPRDVGDMIAGQSNASHDGAGEGWPEMCRLTMNRVEPSWLAFTRKMDISDHVDETDSQQSGLSLKRDKSEVATELGEGDDVGQSARGVKGSARYKLQWQFVSQRWGPVCPGGKPQYLMVRRLCRRPRCWF